MEQTTKAQTFTCTPHFKADAEKPWIVLEGESSLSLYITSDTSFTLEDVAQMVENITPAQVPKETDVRTGSVRVRIQYQGSVTGMTFRGQVVQRAQMVNCAAKEYIRDNEPFDVIYAQTQSTSVNTCALV